MCGWLGDIYQPAAAVEEKQVSKQISSSNSSTLHERYRYLHSPQLHLNSSSIEVSHLSQPTSSKHLRLSIQINQSSKWPHHKVTLAIHNSPHHHKNTTNPPSPSHTTHAKCSTTPRSKWTPLHASRHEEGVLMPTARIPMVH